MKANDRQEAGTHYQQPQGVPQHWDLVTTYHWDYFQSQITKYVMRWKNKHATPEKRLEDLKKARHFLDKYIEEHEKYDPLYGLRIEKLPEDVALKPGEVIRVEPEKCSPTTHVLHRNDPGFVEINTDWQCEGWYGDNTNLYRCRHCRSLFRTKDSWAAEKLHGACPKGRGYVKQD